MVEVVGGLWLQWLLQVQVFLSSGWPLSWGCTRLSSSAVKSCPRSVSSKCPSFVDRLGKGGPWPYPDLSLQCWTACKCTVFCTLWPLVRLENEPQQCRHSTYDDLKWFSIVVPVCPGNDITWHKGDAVHIRQHVGNRPEEPLASWQWVLAVLPPPLLLRLPTLLPLL